MKQKLGRNPLTQRKPTRVAVLVEEDFQAPTDPDSYPVLHPVAFVDRVSKMNVRFDWDHLRQVLTQVLTKGQ